MSDEPRSTLRSLPHRARGPLTASGTPWRGIADVARAALASGSVAAAVSSTALVILAVSTGKSAAQPFNATSHWLHGAGAARSRRFDLARTGVGYATHHAATIFWATFFEAWASARPVTRMGEVVTRALAVSALAATVDYTITPKRLTPGWEYVLSKRAMALVYVAMAAGFAGTALRRHADGAR